MLIDPKLKEYVVSETITQEMINSVIPFRHQLGIYTGYCMDLMFDPEGGKFEEYPVIGKPQKPPFQDMGEFNCYGVCDSIEQLLETLGHLLEGPRQFFIITHNIKADEQPSSGGWRWHKWGPYIGKGKPQYEYIYDEPVLRDVWIYNIYERI